MKILFTLCGRAGSKGFKNKNLKDFLGAPLVYYSIAVIQRYIEKNIERYDIDVVINTDSPELIEIATSQDRVKMNVIEREESLGGDAVPKVSVIKDCLDRMVKITGHDYDVVVDLDITSPLRTLKDVDNAIDKKLSRNDTDVVYSVTGSRRNPYFNMVKCENGFFSKAIASEYTARQQAPEFFDMNASIYAYSVDALRTKNHAVFFNDKCDAIIMKDTAVLDIDSEEDYQLMQIIAGYIFENDKEFNDVRETALALRK